MSTKKKQPAVPETALINHIALVIDDSGSMNSLRSEVIKSYNEQIAQFALDSENANQVTLISVYKFASSTARVVSGQLASSLPVWGYSDYEANGGWTALYDAALVAIKDLETKPDVAGVAKMLIVVTDGEDNKSMYHQLGELKHKVATLTATDRWTFVGTGPSKSALMRMGFPEGNIRQWQGRNEYIQTAQAVKLGASSYMTSRSAGKTATLNFFADLGNVSASKVKRAADDVTALYKLLNVPTEEDIRVRVERATRKPYEPGQAFYQLSKPEKIQGYKEIVLKDNRDDKLYGGSGVRDLLGLPDEDAKITPKNHGHYDIFVQSKSNNRKLVRGSKLLIKR